MIILCSHFLTFCLEILQALASSYLWMFRTPSSPHLSLPLLLSLPLIFPLHYSPIVQRLNSLLSLSLAQFSWVRKFEESRSKLHQPLWINSRCLSHVLLGCQYQLMIDHPVNEVGTRSSISPAVSDHLVTNLPVRLPVEKCTGRMYVHSLVVNNCLVAFLGILCEM